MTQVRGALTSVPEFSDIELSNSSSPPTGQFKCEKGFDFEAKLNELAEKADKLQDWSTN